MTLKEGATSMAEVIETEVIESRSSSHTKNSKVDRNSHNNQINQTLNIESNPRASIISIDYYHSFLFSH